MRKLLVLTIGLAFGVASCAPYAATSQPTQAPTDAPTVPTQTQEPTATADVQEPTPTAEVEDPAASATSETLDGGEVNTPVPGTRNFQPQLEQISVDLNEVVTLLPPDAIQAVLPQRAQDIMVPAAEADAVGIDQSVQVIGVEINGESRAYPIPYLSAHEIVNDTVGGRKIAVTW